MSNVIISFKRVSNKLSKQCLYASYPSSYIDLPIVLAMVVVGIASSVVPDSETTKFKEYSSVTISI